MSQDSTLIDLADVRTIAGNLSPNVEADQMDPYILEGQTGEIREFLGDEMYLSLLEEYDKNATEGSVVDLLTTDGNFTAGLGDTGFWEKGVGWEVAFAGFLDFQSFDSPRAYDDGELIEGSVNMALGTANPIDVTLIDGNGAATVGDTGISVTADGEFPFDITVPVGFVNPGQFRIAANFAWTGGSLFGTRFHFDRNSQISDRMFKLMKGIDYENDQGQNVRFNGLEEVLKYWSYYRFVTANDMQNLRFGNRLAADGIFSDAQTRKLVKGVVYRAKSQALKFQADARRYIETFPDLYPDFTNNNRKPPSRSFEFNKLP